MTTGVFTWGRYCKDCDCLTGSDDPAWPNCWFCGALIILAPVYNPMAQVGRAPSLHQALTLDELLKDASTTLEGAA